MRPLQGPKTGELSGLLRTYWRAIRPHAVSGLILQVFAAGMVAAYYFLPPCRDALDRLAAWRMRLGWVYSPLATAWFGGIIPFAYLRLRRDTRTANPVSHFWFHVLFWMYKGWEVDAFYRLQAWLFGRDPSWGTVVKKMLLDELIYAPLWATPVILALYRWKDSGFRRSVFSETDWRRYFRATYPTTVLSTWAVWIPVVAAIYSLPFPLQIPLFNLELCFWVLLFTALTNRKATA